MRGDLASKSIVMDQVPATWLFLGFECDEMGFRKSKLIKAYIYFLAYLMIFFQLADFG